MAVNEQSISNGSVVVAYFSDGEDAQRAITELKDEGFSSNEIGAAFHSSRTGRPASENLGATSTPSVGKEVGDRVNPAITGIGSGATGPKSDTSAVTPAGLSTGSGTVTAGASRPGPIPGSDIPHHRASDETATSSASSGISSATNLASGIAPGTGSTDTRPAETSEHKSHSHEGESWWHRLKHIFEDDSEQNAERADNTQTKSSLNFGTGEGHLGIAPQGNSYKYSGRTFESSFSGMGVPADHSRRLAQELGQGGAVVTVRKSGRVSEAESILERNGGRVRHESSTASPAWDTTETDDTRVELFGDVRRSYSALSDSNKDDIRKAS